MKDETPQNGFTTIAKFWPIITSIILVAVSWGVAISKFTSVEKELTTLQADVREYRTANIEILTKLGKLETSIEFIKEKVR